VSSDNLKIKNKRQANGLPLAFMPYIEEMGFI